MQRLTDVSHPEASGTMFLKVVSRNMEVYSFVISSGINRASESCTLPVAYSNNAETERVSVVFYETPLSQL